MATRLQPKNSPASSSMHRAAMALLASGCLSQLLAAGMPMPQGDPGSPTAAAPAGAFTPADPQTPADAPATTATPAYFRGRLRTLYFLRWTGDESDNDIFTYLSLNVGNVGRDQVTGYLEGRVNYDLDGRGGVFTSINDSYGGRLNGLLFAAYADIHDIKGLSLVRLGRQTVYDSPLVAFFDGAHVASEEFGELALQVGGYVGSSVRLYESSQTGDLTAGGYAQLRPWQDGRVRLDYMHLEDRNLLRGNDDDLLGAGIWQNIGRNLQLDAQYTRIANRDRDVLGRAIWRVSDWGLLLQASYFALLRTQGDLVLEANPFFGSLNELRPYNQWSLLASKDIGQMLQLQAAGDLRRVRDQDDVGVYNRDFDHYYGTATLTDFGPDGLSVSATIDFWDSNDQLTRSWGADASYRFDRTTASLGTYYSLYKFDLFNNSERDHVRTYYCRLRHQASTAITLEGDYELEDNDFDQFHRMRLGVTWRF